MSHLWKTFTFSRLFFSDKGNLYFGDIRNHGLSSQTSTVSLTDKKKQKPVFRQTQRIFYTFASCEKEIENIYQCYNFFYVQFRINFSFCTFSRHFLANIYSFKFNHRSIRKRCEICSKLTIKTPEQRQWRRSSVFIINFKDISHLSLVFLLLNLNK